MFSLKNCSVFNSKINAEANTSVQWMEIDGENWANAQLLRLFDGQIDPDHNYSNFPRDLFSEIPRMLRKLLNDPPFRGDRTDRAAVATHLYRSMATKDPNFPRWWVKDKEEKGQRRKLLSHLLER